MSVSNDPTFTPLHDTTCPVKMDTRKNTLLPLFSSHTAHTKFPPLPQVGRPSHKITPLYTEKTRECAAISNRIHLNVYPTLAPTRTMDSTPYLQQASAAWVLFARLQAWWGRFGKFTSGSSRIFQRSGNCVYASCSVCVRVLYLM